MNFMGNEWGQLREWDEKRQQDWELRTYPTHDGFHRFMQDLNGLYLRNPALWAADYQEDGFSWIDCHQEEKCIYAIRRRSGSGELVALFNFSDREQTYQLPKPYNTLKFQVLLDTEQSQYGGNATKEKTVKNNVELAPFSGLLLDVK